MTRIKKWAGPAHLALIAVVLTCCEANGTTYEKATEQYCQLFNPDSWHNVQDKNNLQAIYGFIVSEAMKIDNEQLRSDLKSLQSRDFSEFHKAIHDTIASRLGKRWKCDNFDDFFRPKQEVIEFSLSDVTEKHIDPASSDTLVIMIAGENEVLVDGKALVDNAQETLSQAIEISLQSKADSATKVYVYLDEGSNGGGLFDIARLLEEKGVESFGLIGYK